VARAGRDLADVGHGLFRQVFPEQDGVAREVLSWLTHLETVGAVESLEFLGDYTLLPWDILYRTPLPEGADAGGDQFWGVRYNLASGRRAGSLRPVPLLEQPAVLLVLDPGALGALSEEQRKRVEDFVAANNVTAVRSLPELGPTLRDRGPDVLYLFCRAGRDGVRIGDAELTPADLGDLLRDDGSGELPWSSRLLLVNACRAGDTVYWQPVAAGFHELGLGGLVLSEEPPAADRASSFGLDLLGRFLYQGEALGPLVQKLRKRASPLGLLYSTNCPPCLRVTWQEVAESETAAEEAELPPLPDEPYRSLIPYDREDRALFVGRDKDTALVADLIDVPATRLVLVHGRASVGKSSLLRAGVLPYLEAEGVGYLGLRDRQEEGETQEADLPVIAVRATNDLAGQLALALTAACASAATFTTPTGRAVVVDLPALLRRVAGGGRQAVSTAIQSGGPAPGAEPLPAEEQAAEAPDYDTLRAALVEDPGLFGRALTALADSLPAEPVLLIEQGEELFTLARQREDADNRRAALDLLRRAAAGPGAGKVVVLLRTEYYGRLVGPLRQDLRDPRGVRDYLLTELDAEGMTEAIVQPTRAEPVPYTREVPFEKYRFRYENDLPEQIVRQVRETARDRPESALPLLQAVCAQLADLGKGRADGTVRDSDLRTATIFAGLAGYVEARMNTLVKSQRDRRQLRTLLGRLYRAQPDGTVTRDLVPVDELASLWTGPTPLAGVIERGAADDVRLFEVDWLGTGSRERQYVSLASDALATVAARWDREDRVRREHGRKVMVDWLWVVVPLGLLALVVAWVLWRTKNSLDVAQKERDESLATSKTATARAELMEGALKAALFPVYLSHISQAENAWRQGDTLHMRQLLLAHRQMPRQPDDVRSFEWYHLWQLMDRSAVTLVGHEAPVTAMALAPDGKSLASAGLDSAVRLWNLDPPGLKAVLQSNWGPLNTVAFAPDGKKMAWAGTTGVVIVWALAKGKEGRSAQPMALGGHKGSVRSVAFAPDGKTLASAGDDGTVRLWDLAGGKAPTTLKEHTGPVLAVAYSPDGKRLASAGAGGRVVLWDPAAGKKVQTLTGPGGPVPALAFSPDGGLLAVGGTTAEGLLGQVKLWDPATGKEARPGLKVAAPVLSLAFVGDGKVLVSGDRGWAIRLWDVEAGRERDVFRGHLGWVSGLAVTPDGKTVATGAYDSTVRLWSPGVPSARQVLTGHQGPALSLALAPDNKTLASGGQDGTIRLWDAATGGQVRVLKGERGPVLSVSLARRDGKLLLASGHGAEGKKGGGLLVWDADKGEALHTLEGHQGSATGVALTPDGALLVSGGADKTVIVWDVRKGTPRRKLAGHQAAVTCVALSPHGQVAVSGDAAGGIRLWDPRAVGAGGSALDKALPGRHTGAVTALGFAGDAHFCSAGQDGVIKFWGVKEGGLLDSLAGRDGPILALAVSPTVDVIVSGGTDRAVRLWDGNTDELRFTFTGAGGPVRGLVFASDHRLLAAASEDGTVRLWRAAPRAPLAPKADEAQRGQGE
jgi:WD40 repeat protein